MTVCQILGLVRALANKDQKGNAITPTQYNLALNYANLALTNSEFSKWDPSLPLPEILRTFRVVIANGTITAGVYTVPSDFREFTSNQMSVTVDSILTVLDRVDDGKAKRLITYPGRNLRERPICVLGDGVINVFPTDASGINFEYLKTPATPVYDYYIDQYRNEVCLAVGAAHFLDPNEYGSAGQLPGNTVNSLTVELEWDDIYHIKVIMNILAQFGVNLRESDVVQFAELQQNKQQ